MSGLAAWALLGSLASWVGFSLAQLADAVTEVPYLLRLGLFLVALPSLLTLLAMPVLGRRAAGPDRS